MVNRTRSSVYFGAKSAEPKRSAKPVSKPKRMSSPPKRQRSTSRGRAPAKSPTKRRSVSRSPGRLPKSPSRGRKTQTSAAKSRSRSRSTGRKTTKAAQKPVKISPVRRSPIVSTPKIRTDMSPVVSLKKMPEKAVTGSWRTSTKLVEQFITKVVPTGRAKPFARTENVEKEDKFETPLKPVGRLDLEFGEKPSPRPVLGGITPRSDEYTALRSTTSIFSPFSGKTREDMERKEEAHSRYFTRSSRMAAEAPPTAIVAPKSQRKAWGKKVAAWMPKMRRAHVPYIITLALFLFVLFAFWGCEWFHDTVVEHSTTAKGYAGSKWGQFLEWTESLKLKDEAKGIKDEI